MQDLSKITDTLISYLKTFYPTAEQIEVDEMELSDNRKRRFITLRFQTAPQTPSELLSNKRDTLYKVFEVEIKTGDVLSMKNRELDWGKPK